ncbi:hypothetical protein IAD21_03911 [Abditibacteriota bacterium]|nr:hypothetical protein IAD21_03911 [Abditibacteriota bacterium]
MEETGMPPEGMDSLVFFSCPSVPVPIPSTHLRSSVVICVHLWLKGFSPHSNSNLALPYHSRVRNMRDVNLERVFRLRSGRTVML